MAKIMETAIQKKIANEVNKDDSMYCIVLPTPRTQSGIYTAKQPIDIVCSRGSKAIWVEVKVCNGNNIWNVNALALEQKKVIKKMLSKGISINILIYWSRHNYYTMHDGSIFNHTSTIRYNEESKWSLSEMGKLFQNCFDET